MTIAAAHTAGLFGRELDPLALAQQFEDRLTDGTAMKKVFDPAFVADESKALVDEKSRDRSRWHTRVLR
jgi:hypothetical protein